MIITNNFGLPKVFVDTVKSLNKDYRHGRRKTDYSVTELMKESLELRLLRHHAGEITQDVTDMIWMMYGSLIHLLLERNAGEKGIAEKRFFKTIAGLMISGQADMIYDNKILQDYKVTSVWSYIYQKYENYEMQLNMLAYLASEYGFEFEQMQAILLFRDWHKSEADRKKEYPKHPVQVIDLKRYAPEDVQTYIESKIMAHRIAASLPIEKIPPCTDEARWMCDRVFKVRKEGRKSSVKNFDNRAGAEIFMEKHKDRDKMWVEEVPKEYRKCLQYCSVRLFCPFGVKDEQKIGGSP